MRKDLDGQSDGQTDDAEFAAAQLIECVKRMEIDQLDLPVVNQACVWKVTVKKMEIRENDRRDL
jgi:hypothetical protein